jgi:hypothetical protein
MTGDAVLEEFNLLHITHLPSQWFPHPRFAPGQPNFFGEDHPAKQNTTTPTSVKISCDLSQDLQTPVADGYRLETGPNWGRDMSFLR